MYSTVQDALGMKVRELIVRVITEDEPARKLTSWIMGSVPAGKQVAILILICSSAETRAKNLAGAYHEANPVAKYLSDKIELLPEWLTVIRPLREMLDQEAGSVCTLDVSFQLVDTASPAQLGAAEPAPLAFDDRDKRILRALRIAAD